LFCNIFRGVHTWVQPQRRPGAARASANVMNSMAKRAVEGERGWALTEKVLV
jgi:hypothetical protein